MTQDTISLARRIDAVIAAEVMGWTTLYANGNPSEGWVDQSRLYRFPLGHPGDMCGDVDWSPSTRIQDAMEALDNLGLTEYSVGLNTDMSKFCAIWDQYNLERRGTTVREAICRALFAAVDEDIEALLQGAEWPGEG